MTFNIGTIQGGTHAGWKKQFAEHIPWLCPGCDKVTNPGYRNQCVLCGLRRP